MTPQLKEFLQKEDTQILLNQRHFYSLFKECPWQARKELLEILDDSGIEIGIDSEHDDTWYGLKVTGARAEFLTVNGFNKKSNAYDYSFIPMDPNRWHKLVVIQDFEQALRIAANYFARAIPEPLNSPFIDKYEWKEVHLTYPKDQWFKITTECADEFDPVKIKERKYGDAVKTAFNDRIEAEIMGRLFTAPTNVIEAALEEFALENTYVDVTAYPRKARVTIEYLPENKPELEYIIKKYCRFPVDIIGVGVGKNFDVFPSPNGKKYNQIRKEVEDEFGMDPVS